jgi:hypothetical protein
MQAVAEAIVRGKCANSEAIAEVLAEVEGDVSTVSTCGMTAAFIAAES